jgi:CO dehydrogenase nickel-insertion accessory protein CooC1
MMMANQEIQELLDVVKNGSTFDSLRAAKRVAELARTHNQVAMVLNRRSYRGRTFRDMMVKKVDDSPSRNEPDKKPTL